MGGNSKKLRWKRATIVEDISGKEGYGSEFHCPPVEKEKKSLLSVVKKFLKKGKKGVAVKAKCSKTEAKESSPNPTTSSIPTDDLTIVECGSEIFPASLLPILSDSAKQAEVAAAAASVPKRINAGPSKGPNFVSTNFQMSRNVQQSSQKRKEVQPEKQNEMEEEQVFHEDELENPVPGAVHYDRPSVKKPEKPTYKKRAEADLKHALEKAEELDKNTFQILDGNQDKRAQLVLIRREAERTKRENKAQKQRNRKNREVDEAEMENKRQANLKKYNEIFLAQGEKVDELTSKLKWLKIKQNGKQRRIDCIVSGQKRSAHQKIQLAGLKRSSKKLEATITRTKAEICRRKETMDNLSDLQEKCKINPDPLNENPTFTGFDLASLPVKRCWGVDSGDKLGTDEEGAPSTISSSEYNSFDEDSDDAEISSMKTERPRTHNIVNRFNPLAMIARLHHSLSKKFKRSRPLGAHAGRLRSVTENMQEIIPYEAQHYDSDPDDEPTRSPTPIDPYGPGGKCEWLVPKTDMTLMEQKQRMEARERYIDDIRREYERLGMNITFSISGDPLKATTTVLGAQKKKKLNAMAENVELPNETQSSSQPGLGESSQAAPDNCQVPNSRPKRPLTIRKTTRQRREKVLRVISPDIAAEVNDLLESESETKESRVNEHQWWLGQTGYGDREREEWQLGLPAQDRPLSSSSESLRVSSTRWRQ